VVAVLWENVGLHGQYCAPTARDVMVAYFNKKQRVAEEEAAKQKLNPATSLVSAILPTLKPQPAQNADRTESLGATQ